MELQHQGVPVRECPLSCRSPRAAPLTTEGYVYTEECEAARPLFVPKEGSGLGKFLDMSYWHHARLPFSYSITCSSIFSVQAIQEVFVAKEWVKDARNEARVEANLRA